MKGTASTVSQSVKDLFSFNNPSEGQTDEAEFETENLTNFDSDSIS